MNSTVLSHGCLCLRSGGAVLLLLATMLGCSTFSSLKSLNERDISAERRKRNEAAAQQFEKARDMAEFEAAQGRWHERDSKGCRERLQNLLARNPQHLDARLLLAEVLLSEHRGEEAIRCLEPAIKDHADDARVQYTMGLVLDAAGQTDRAMSYYQQAARLEPDNELYAVVQQKALDGVRTQVAGQVAGQVANQGAAPSVQTPSSARAAAPAVKPAAPSSDVIRTGYMESAAPPDKPRPLNAILQPASILADFGPDQADSSQDADRNQDSSSAATTAPPGRAESATATELLEQAGRALTDGSTTDAATLLRRAIAAKPEDLQIPISAAVLVLQHNRPELAIELIEPAVKRFPNSAALYRILGTAYYRRGDYPSSQRALQQALSLDKTSALSYFLMGCTLARLGQAEAAETQFRQAQLLDSRYTERRAGAAGSLP